MSENVQGIAHTSTPHLSRQLGLWAIVGLGLGYMTPMTVFDTFGIVSGETNAVVHFGREDLLQLLHHPVRGRGCGVRRLIGVEKIAI